MADRDTHWSRIGESGTMLGMKTLLLGYRLFGRRGFRVLLFPVIGYFFLFRREARLASQEYLRQVSPYLDDEQRARLSSFRHFMMFGEILLDKLLVWIGRITRDHVVFATPETITEIEGNRKGGIIVVSHLGNFEVCSALANQLPDMRLTILVYTRHAVKFNSLMRRYTGDVKVEIMQVTDVSPATSMLLADRIGAGEYVVIAGDRTPVTGHQRVSRARFFGRDAPLPQGAFILAGLLQCPVYLLFCLKQEGRYHVYIEAFRRRLEFGVRAARTQTLQEAVQAYAQRLEQYCLLAPLQWFNFFPYWSESSIAPVESTAARGRETEITQD